MSHGLEGSILRFSVGMKIQDQFGINDLPILAKLALAEYAGTCIL
jgi:hypothetical protein